MDHEAQRIADTRGNLCDVASGSIVDDVVGTGLFRSLDLEGVDQRAVFSSDVLLVAAEGVDDLAAVHIFFSGLASEIIIEGRDQHISIALLSAEVLTACSDDLADVEVHLHTCDLLVLGNSPQNVDLLARLNGNGVLVAGELAVSGLQIVDDRACRILRIILLYGRGGLIRSYGRGDRSGRGGLPALRRLTDGDGQLLGFERICAADALCRARGVSEHTLRQRIVGLGIEQSGRVAVQILIIVNIKHIGAVLQIRRKVEVEGDERVLI